MVNSSRSNSSVAGQLTQIGMAAPQVIAHRLTRMAQAGPVLSKRDQQEFSGMVMEKQTAFMQSWMAMGMETFRLQVEFAQSAWKAWATLATGGKASAYWSDLPKQFERGSARVIGKGLAPVRRKAVSNAKRLNRSVVK